jgi:hypothetical protein
MPPSFRLALAACVLCLGACQRAGDSDGTAPAPPPAAEARPGPASAPGPATPVEDAASYACADGTRLRAAFGGGAATLEWPDGRTVRLPRAESASKGGGDVYVGEAVSLQRDGQRLQLHDGDRPATECVPGAPGAAGAAARYACEGDATLVREADGSFRAEIPGNPPVRLAPIAGSTPPVYTGASLYLRIGDGGATLSQGDRANELRCSAD